MQVAMRRSEAPGKGIRYPGPVALILVWGLVGVLAYGRHYLEDRSSNAAEDIFVQILIWQTCFLPWAGLTPLAFRLERRYPLGGANWPRNLAVLAAAGLPLAYLGAELSLVLSLGVEVALRRPFDFFRSWWKPPILELSVNLLMYGSAVVAGYVIRNLMSLHQREQETAELALQKSQLESSLRQTELEVLRTRLNPHFLFNCLQNISILTREDPKKANQMLTRLGDLLRAALCENSSPETTLRAEIALTKSYVAVEKIRFADRLSVVFDVAADSESALVPTFLLQPLVENAIVHGLRDVELGGVISIRSTTASGSLILTVTDNGAGLPAKSMAELETGIGLTSTCERLARMYPQEHSFAIRDLPERGAEVEVILPLRYKTPPTGVTAHEPPSLADRR